MLICLHLYRYIVDLKGVSMPKFLKLAVSTAAIIALSGCATMKNGIYDKVEIVSNVDAAHCKIYRDGEGFLKSVSTPDARYISRSEKSITVTCKKRGFEDVSVTVSPSEGDPETDGVVNVETRNNIFNFGVGFIIDKGTSAFYHYPEVIEVNFKK